VFPADFVCLSPTVSAAALTQCLVDTIARIDEGSTMSAQQMHRSVKEMYSWDNVTARVEQVYKESTSSITLSERMSIQYSKGVIAGKLYCVAYALCFILLNIVQWFQPVNSVDVVPYVYHDKHREEGRSNKILDPEHTQEINPDHIEHQHVE